MNHCAHSVFHQHAPPILLPLPFGEYLLHVYTVCFTFNIALIHHTLINLNSRFIRGVISLHSIKYFLLMTTTYADLLVPLPPPPSPSPPLSLMKDGDSLLTVDELGLGDVLQSVDEYDSLLPSTFKEGPKKLVPHCIYAYIHIVLPCIICSACSSICLYVLLVYTYQHGMTCIYTPGLCTHTHTHTHTYTGGIISLLISLPLKELF